MKYYKISRHGFGSYDQYFEVISQCEICHSCDRRQIKNIGIRFHEKISTDIFFANENKMIVNEKVVRLCFENGLTGIRFQRAQILNINSQDTKLSLYYAIVVGKGNKVAPNTKMERSPKICPSCHKSKNGMFLLKSEKDIIYYYEHNHDSSDFLQFYNLLEYVVSEKVLHLFHKHSISGCDPYIECIVSPNNEHHKWYSGANDKLKEPYMEYEEKLFINNISELE